MTTDAPHPHAGNGATRATARAVTPAQAQQASRPTSSPAAPPPVRSAPAPAPARAPAPAPASAPAQRPAPPPKVSRLAQAKRGRVHKPPRICIYGAKKIGKTTLACAAPNALLIDANRGSEYIDVARYPFYPGEPNETSPNSFTDLMDGLADIRDNVSEYRTLVVDVLNDVEMLIWKHILKEDATTEKPLTSIEDYGYAKGYQIAVDRGWIPFLRTLDEIRDRRGMAIVLVEHSSIAEFKSPTTTDYHRHVMKIHKHAASAVAGWVDVLAYYSFDDLATKRPGMKRSQGVYSGRRVLHVDHDATFDGGSRIPLPPDVEVAIDDPWRPFAEAIAEGQAMPPEHVLADIRIELARVGDEGLTGRIEQWAEGKSVDQLWRCLVQLRHREPSNDTAAAAPQEG